MPVYLTAEQKEVFDYFRAVTSFYVFLKAINEPEKVSLKDTSCFIGWGLTREEELMNLWLNPTNVEVL